MIISIIEQFYCKYFNGINLEEIDRLFNSTKGPLYSISIIVIKITNSTDEKHWKNEKYQGLTLSKLQGRHTAEALKKARKIGGCALEKFVRNFKHGKI